MDYQLAKELKDAGFKQEGHGGYWKPPFETPEIYVEPPIQKCHDNRPGFEPAIYVVPEQVKWFYVPTLSELIEACGDGLMCLYRDKDWKGKNQFWVATPEDPSTNDWDSWTGLRPEGKTPEEAVARLWLALNQK